MLHYVYMLWYNVMVSLCGVFMKRLVVHLSIGISILILFTACARTAPKPSARRFIPAPPTPTPPVALSVNGVPILKETVDTRRAMLQPVAEKIGASSNLESLVIDTLIDRVLIEKTADALGVQNVPAAEKVTRLRETVSPDTFGAWLEKNRLSAENFEVTVRAEMEAQAVFNAVTASVPQSAAQIHARCLRFADEPAAQAARRQLADGTPFAALAATNACTADAKSHGGDLGWFPAGIGVLPADIEPAAFAIQPGSTGDVLASGDGFFIIRVETRADNRPLTPEHHYQLRVVAFRQWLANQRASAHIERIAN